MITKGKVSEILTTLSRYSLSQNGLDSQCRMMQQIFKTLQTADKYDHRTMVLIYAGSKCLDQRDWLQIQCGDISAQISALIAEAQGTSDDNRREKLLIEILAQAKLIAQAQIIGNELYVLASEYLLQVQTFMLSSLSGEDAVNVSENHVAAPDRTINDQLQVLRSVVDSIIGELAGVSRFVNGPWFVQEDDSLESKVQERSLIAIVAFANKVASQAVGLADVAVASMPMIGQSKAKEMVMRKQWLVAYAMTAATVAGACNTMVSNGFMAYGNISVAENRGQAGPSDGPAPRPAADRRN